MSNDLSIDRTFRATPEVVFDAYLAMHGDERPDWIADSRLDLRPGGRWTVSFRPPGVEAFQEERTFTEADVPRRLAYAMRSIFAGAPGFETTVELTFDEEGVGTQASLVQRGFPTPEARDDFAGGWPGVFDELERFVDRRRSLRNSL
jgi:uncharacterized protein YndB with AHSA1/START domain